MREVLQSLFGPEVTTDALPVDDATVASLYPEEAQLIARAVPKRRREFATGRVLARRLLLELGEKDVGPILRRDDRAPVWPRGVTGSITHTDALCGVVVAREERVRALGIDFELNTPLKAELVRIVLRDEETARDELAKLVFSAKECVYKCQHTVTRMMLEFHDVAIELDERAQTFHARVLNADAARLLPRDLRGRYAVAGDTVVTGMRIDR